MGKVQSLTPIRVPTSWLRNAASLEATNLMTKATAFRNFTPETVKFQKEKSGRNQRGENELIRMDSLVKKLNLAQASEYGQTRRCITEVTVRNHR
jgi:hypothetical protein